MPQDFDLELKGLEEALLVLWDTANGSERVMSRTMYRIGALVHGVAREFAPRSPTISDIRKATGRAMKIRKASGTSRPKPGGLERSIEFDSSSTDATIYVASNSEAGLYAFIIHEEKGTTWFDRGVGTISKGPQADDEFITRAIKDQARNAIKIVSDEQAKAFQGAK